MGDAILGNSEDIPHGGVCKDKFLSTLCSSDHFPNVKPFSASTWEVSDFPKAGMGGNG